MCIAYLSAEIPSTVSLLSDAVSTQLCSVIPCSFWHATLSQAIIIVQILLITTSKVRRAQ